MTAQIWLTLLVVLLVLDFLVDTIVEWVNHKYDAWDSLHPMLKPYFDAETIKKTKAYQKDNFNFSIFSSAFSLILVLFVFNSGLLGTYFDWLNARIENPIFSNLLFFGTAFVANDLITLPFQLYKTFVIEQNHGFNKTTPTLFLTDKLKGYLLAFLIGGFLIGLLLWVIEYVGPQFWMIFWVIASIFILLANMFFVSWIMPLFYKFTPIESGELSDAINDYCKKVNFPLSGVYVIDGSKRSSKSNAFFSGIGKTKKVVFYDTLLKNNSVDEIIAILAHEVGHYKHNHLYVGMVFSVINIGLTLYLMSLFVYDNELSLALGASKLSYVLNIIAFSIILTPISKLVSIFFNQLSRKNEYEADNYAKETYRAQPLADALLKLSKENLSNPQPHPIYVYLNYSHPTVSQRIDKMGV